MPEPDLEPEPFVPEPEVEPEPIALMMEDMVDEEPEDDVLDLTEFMAEEPEDDPLEDFLEPEPEPRPMFSLSHESDLMDEVPDVLLEKTTQDVSEQAFASLASVLAERNVGIGQLGITLEELVRELLRPILKVWLDENLPVIVERVVEREVERIVNRIGPMK
jgi:cell pole-organizing protein PopZ